MNEMNITSAQYVLNRFNENSSIRAIINGVELYIPLSEGNRHYAEIMRQVEAGELTIADAE
jgi:hypothetical protein